MKDVLKLLPIENPARSVLLQNFARIGHALSTPSRLAMIGLLTHGEKTVEQLAQASGQTVASASAHLKVLRGACLVTSQKRGRHVHCRLAGDNVTGFWLALRSLGEELLPEAREVLAQFMEDPNLLAPLTPKELASELKNGRVTVLDLRPEDEFAAGHLPGAYNIPYATLISVKLRQLGLPAGKPVYAYCRGPYCVMAQEGTKKLRSLGIHARALRFSVPEWKAESRSVDISFSSNR